MTNAEIASCIMEEAKADENPISYIFGALHAWMLIEGRKAPSHLEFMQMVEEKNHGGKEKC